MQINGVNGLVPKLDHIGSGTTGKEHGFSDILSEAVGNIRETEGAVQQENVSLLTGETDDLHTPVIESQKAELALNLAIQVRNKVVEAYNEVMRMQV